MNKTAMQEISEPKTPIQDVFYMLDELEKNQPFVYNKLSIWLRENRHKLMQNEENIVNDTYKQGIIDKSRNETKEKYYNKTYSMS